MHFHGAVWSDPNHGDGKSAFQWRLTKRAGIAGPDGRAPKRLTMPLFMMLASRETASPGSWDSLCSSLE